MDCEGILDFSEPVPSFLDNDAVLDDMYRDLASWEVANVDDANFSGLMSFEPAIEGPPPIAGELQPNNNGQGLESGVTFNGIHPMNLLLITDEFRELNVGDSKPNWLYQDPPERNEFHSFPVDPVAAYFGESAPCSDPPGTGQSLQSFPGPVEPHFISESPGVEWFNTSPCIVCGNYSKFHLASSCSHTLCQEYCRETWLQGEGQACPDCWYAAGEDVNASRVSSGRNLEYRPDHEHAQELIIHQQGYHPAQDLDIIGYQPEEAGMEYFHETLPVAESEPSVMLIDLPEGLPSNSKQSEQRHGRRKRARETLVVDHNGVAMRYDGSEERFTAYYRPSYWTEDDSSVFLGEYPTHEEAVDAHNLVALLHEGRDARIILPYTADRYKDQLKRWEGKHHADLVCELRLRGRGLLKDGTVNYKHVGRRWSGKKKGTRHFSTVSDDPVSASTANTGKPKRTFLTTFDTPEQAARCADQVLVKRKGPEAWTNFPLSSYFTSKDQELPLSFLPISNNFRDNLTYKRTKPDVAFS